MHTSSITKAPIARENLTVPVYNTGLHESNDPITIGFRSPGGFCVALRLIIEKIFGFASGETYPETPPHHTWLGQYLCGYLAFDESDIHLMTPRVFGSFEDEGHGRQNMLILGANADLLVMADLRDLPEAKLFLVDSRKLMFYILSNDVDPQNFGSKDFDAFTRTYYNVEFVEFEIGRSEPGSFLPEFDRPVLQLAL